MLSCSRSWPVTWNVWFGIGFFSPSTLLSATPLALTDAAGYAKSVRQRSTQPENQSPNVGGLGRGGSLRGCGMPISHHPGGRRDGSHSPEYPTKQATSHTRPTNSPVSTSTDQNVQP